MFLGLERRTVLLLLCHFMAFCRSDAKETAGLLSAMDPRLLRPQVRDQAQIPNPKLSNHFDLKLGDAGAGSTAGGAEVVSWLEWKCFQ